jgi:hypothetical protein
MKNKCFLQTRYALCVVQHSNFHKFGKVCNKSVFHGLPSVRFLLSNLPRQEFGHA